MTRQSDSVRHLPYCQNSSSGSADSLSGGTRKRRFTRVKLHCLLKTASLICAILLPVVCHAESLRQGTRTDEKAAPTWSLAVTGGFTNTFQLILGGKYGAGPDFQNKLNIGVNNVLRGGDSLSTFGWSSTDVPSATPNWQAGLLYKVPVIIRKNHALSLTGSAQRWILPMVGHGTKDWFVIGNMTYGTSIKRVPVFISEDAYSLVKSNLPTGQALYSQIYTQQPLFSRHGVRLALRHGPAYTYSWGLYGCTGNRVVRYSGTLISSFKGTTLEAGYRQQFGLQDKIPNNRYWSLLITRQYGGAFHHE